MMNHSKQSIFADLSEILRTFNGRDYSEPIVRETLLFGELGMVSIDAIVLGEHLESKYHRKFPFSDFLSDLARRGADDLRVGELVDFLQECMAVGSAEC